MGKCAGTSGKDPHAMTKRIPDSAHEIEQQGDVQAALEQTAAPKEEPHRLLQRFDRIWLITCGAILVVAIAVELVNSWNLLRLAAGSQAALERIALGTIAFAAALGILKVLNIFLIDRIGNVVIRFNLRRILNLVVAVVLAFVLVSILFVNWYTAVVSLGLASLILGFALQTPITSFIGWIYILARTPYRVGDRIKIGDATGDVIDVSYLDTTLWEFGGQYLSTDHPSGRIIKFPNSSILNSPVWNYSWPLFPYIWNEVKLHIAYEADMEFVATTMLKVAKEEVGIAMAERVKIFRDLLAKTPVDHLQVQGEPVVFFRVSENTWLEAILRYLVHPKEAGRVKSRLIRKLMPALNAAPERVLFPKLNAR